MDDSKQRGKPRRKVHYHGRHYCLLRNSRPHNSWWVLVLVVLAAGAVSLSEPAQPGDESIGNNGHGHGNTNINGTSTVTTDLQPWQACSTYLAPTVPTTTTPTSETMEWGIFANRDYVKGEIVELAPLTLPMSATAPQVQDSALNDYVYGYWRVIPQKDTTIQPTSRPKVKQLYAVLWGATMWCNHHPTDANVEFTTFGREPILRKKRDDNRVDDDEKVDPVLARAVNVLGLLAKRDIRRGEQLYSRYDHGKDDHGISWFRERGLVMQVPDAGDNLPPVPPLDGHNHHAQSYCSKIYAGIGRPSWEHRLLPILPPDRSVLPFLIPSKDDNENGATWGNSSGNNSNNNNNNELPPLPLAPDFDAGFGNARAKVFIQKGERIEVGRALVMSLYHHSIRGSALRPLVLAWEDLDPQQHHDVLRGMRNSTNSNNNNSFMVQYQGPSTSWEIIDGFRSFEDLALLPVGGNIGMVRRVGGSEDATRNTSNCRLMIHPTNLQPHSVGVTLELIATQDVDAGEVLLLNLPPAGTKAELSKLYKELRLTGQPFHKPLFASLAKLADTNKENDNYRSQGSDQEL